GEEHQRQETVAVLLGVPERDGPERDEREEPEPAGAAQRDDCEQKRERARTVLSRSCPRPRLLGREAPEVAQGGDQHPRHDDPWKREQEAPRATGAQYKRHG